ncbi:glycosyltransferase [Synechococcus sp. MIT S1220]|uniref:glycosyltransferase family protein n=1 Tax=Synechococcus sp. MIT S1220 TaxID=3082549 RepID=UPI0039AEC37E
MPAPTVLFISAQPGSVGHIYRVTNHVERLREQGFAVHVLPPPGANAAIEALPRIRAVVVFRPTHDADFQEWRLGTQRRGVPLLLDLDDLTFDAELLERGEWPYWQSLSEAGQRHWHQRFVDQDRALLQADGAIVSTEPLADAVRARGQRAWVWPNGFGQLSWETARAARQSEGDDDKALIRIGYASGTPTHAADFAEIAPALAVVLERHPQTRLCVVGALDLGSYPALQSWAGRLEERPVVPYPQLPSELRRFTINVAPLQINSRFCQAKSALKFFEAAAVGVPSIVSATVPFASLVRHRRNGCLASSQQDWIASLDWLISDARARRRLARRALRTVRRHCSPAAQGRCLEALLAGGLFAESHPS